MAPFFQSVAIAGKRPDTSRSSASTEARLFLRHAAWFVLIGIVLYAGLYAGTEKLVYHYARVNRFFKVKTAPYEHYDAVILGDSHAAVFDLEDMNARLESMTNSRILNLSTTGGGITINRLLLEYFLERHQTSTVVYVLDSFVLDSRQWNEDRLQDDRLFVRAPLDLSLARLMLRSSVSSPVILKYVSGFSKINNPDRFLPEVPEFADRFEKTYRPVKQIDQQRLQYLFPKEPDEDALQRRYWAELEDMMQYLKARNIRVIVIKPPIPQRVYRLIPNQDEFDSMLKQVSDRRGVEFHDFSLVSNDEKYFFNTDHLNRTGVLNFFQNYLKDVLVTPPQQK